MTCQQPIGRHIRFVKLKRAPSALKRGPRRRVDSPCPPRSPLFSPQKIAFMVALGLVTTEHLEGELTIVPGRSAICWRRLRLSVTRLFFRQKSRQSARRGRDAARPTRPTAACSNPRSDTHFLFLRDRGSDVRASVVTFFLLSVCAAA